MFCRANKRCRAQPYLTTSRQSFLLVILIGFFFNIPAFAKDTWTMRITKETRGYHLPWRDRLIPIDDPAKSKFAEAYADYYDMMSQVCDAMGLSVESGDCNIFALITRRLTRHPNAIAIVYEGNKVIVYDRRFSRQLGYSGAIAIIGHEIGHHYCRHLYKVSSPKLELEADRFAGASMRRAGYSLSDALAATKNLSERASLSHPGRSRRRKAVRQGWKNPASAKRCR